MTISLIWTKVISLTALFCLVVAFGLFPVKLFSCFRKLRGGNADLRDFIVLRLLSCFAGGLFLGTFLIHLLPEVREQFEDIRHQTDIQSEFPMAEFLTAIGFFIVMVLENVVETYHDGGHNYAKMNAATPEQISISHSGVETLSLLSETKNKGNLQVSPLRSLLLLLALSLHTLFEGLALGLQDTESKVWNLFLAICIHKAVIAFALSLELCQKLSTRYLLLSVFAFSLMSPIGIAIGIGVTETSEASLSQDLASVILQGLASGTFLYVTFFEILQKEMMDTAHDLRHVLSVILGFSLIAGLWFQNGADHHQPT